MHSLTEVAIYDVVVEENGLLGFHFIVTSDIAAPALGRLTTDTCKQLEIAVLRSSSGSLEELKVILS